MFSPSQPFFNKLVTGTIAQFVLGTPLVVDLFNVDLVPTEFIDPATLTPCAFTGYSPANVTVSGGSVINNSDGSVSYTFTTLASFLQTAATATDTAYGYKIGLSGSPDVYLGGENWGSPIQFNAVDRGCSLTITLVIGPNGAYLASSLLTF